MATRLSAQLKKRYAKFSLDAELRLGDGVTALVGPSGAGKTTVLRLLAGLEQPDEGVLSLGDTVWFDSSKRLNIPVQRRRVGFVFNDYALFPQMTVWENVLYGAQDPGHAQELLEILEMASLKERYPRQLSAGQQQRVAIARVLANRPRVLLMDEPFSSIDPYLKSQVYEEFLALQRQLGIATVIVTHDLNEASRLASDMVVLDQGRILQTGSPEQVMLQPQCIEVARMVGIRNLFRSELQTDRLHWGPYALQCDAGDRKGAQDWYIRADRIQLGPHAMDCENTLSATITEMAVVGQGYRILTQLEKGKRLEVFASAATVERLGLVSEKPILLGVPADAITFFPRTNQSPIEMPAISQ